MKKICLTVTTDLTYDQRMIRICTSLADAGYGILLIGRKKGNSLPLAPRPYRQKRLYTFFEKGKFFYIEYNIRLFCYLLTCQPDAFCAIDLDSILPVWMVARLKKKARVYDAHELFCEMKEVVTRPGIYRIWKKIEKTCVPSFTHGYTVNQPIAEEFKKMYGVDYKIIRNVPLLKPLLKPAADSKFIICQGSVNEGRCFESLIPAMRLINIPLIICGDGNFMAQLKQLIKKYDVADKVILKGLVQPEELRTLTQEAWLGLSLFENNGRSVYLSLANRFFDYIHAAIPQLCSDFPAYRDINNQLPVALLIDDFSPENIARSINELAHNEQLYTQLCNNCMLVRQQLNWEKEKETLTLFYKKLFEAVE
ncbi:MAG: glycosyltransferase [Chitinophagaceae bacterium]